jgi:hypothetical protein
LQVKYSRRRSGATGLSRVIPGGAIDYECRNEQAGSERSDTVEYGISKFKPFARFRRPRRDSGRGPCARCHCHRSFRTARPPVRINGWPEFHPAPFHVESAGRSICASRDGAAPALIDTEGHAYRAYGVAREALVVIRPDGHIGATGTIADLAGILQYAASSDAGEDSPDLTRP